MTDTTGHAELIGRLRADENWKNPACRDAAFALDAAERRAVDDREAVAAWIILHGFATGHGDNIEGMLGQLTPQIESALAQARKDAFEEAAGELDRRASEFRSKAETIGRNTNLSDGWTASADYIGELAAAIRALSTKGETG